MICFMENSIVLQSPYCAVKLLIIWEIPDVFAEIKWLSRQIKSLAICHMSCWYISPIGRQEMQTDLRQKPMIQSVWLLF